MPFRRCVRCRVRYAQDKELCRRCGKEVGQAASIEAQRRHEERIAALMKPSAPEPVRRRFLDVDTYGTRYVCEVVWDGR